MFTSNLYKEEESYIPSTWVFKHYLNLEEDLTGSRVKLKSVFNEADNKPSMFLYYDVETSMYKFKDFSTGYQGGCLTLVSLILGVGEHIAMEHIKTEYEEYLKTGKPHATVLSKNVAISNSITWSVKNVVYRCFTIRDAKYWVQFNISSDILNLYNVKAIDSYDMQGFRNGKLIKEFSVKGRCIYGYHDDTGELAKIYEPTNINLKFLKLKDYIQGSNNLYKYNTLIITSSLKDAMCVHSLGLRVDVIAPDSENTMLDEKFVKTLKKRYPNIIVLFDSDMPGIKAMLRYKELYNFPFIYIPLEKDIADVMKHHGKTRVLIELVPKINAALSL